MPVTEYSQYCPLLLEGDILSLSSDFWVDQTTLVDIDLGLQHQLRQDAANIVRTLCGAITFNDLLQKSLKQRLSHEDVINILGFLNTIGALRVSPVSPWRSLARKAHHLILGVRYPPISWRAPATGKWLVVGCIRASTHVSLASLLCFGSIAASGYATPPKIVAFWMLFVGTFITSLIIHEGTHLLFIQRHRSRLLQRSLRLYLLHPASTPRQEIISALCGPAAGAATCLVSAGAWWGMSQSSLQTGVLGAICLTHLGSLLPAYSDGKTIITNWKKKHVK